MKFAVLPVAVYFGSRYWNLLNQMQIKVKMLAIQLELNYTRVRLQFSHLPKQKFRHIPKANWTHYAVGVLKDNLLLRCHFLNDLWTTLMNDLSNIDSDLSLLRQSYECLIIRWSEICL